VADGYAKDGFLAVAPALFDRIEPNVELTYEGDDMTKARSFIPKLNMEKALLDVEAAMKYAAASASKKIAVIGYCFGGSIAWLAAARLKPVAVVGYYGGQIAKFAEENPQCPVMLHFGRQDAHIPRADVDKVKDAHPDVEIYWYDAGHAFNRDVDPNVYKKEIAALALQRTLSHLQEHLS
jgi:carboxymethylenebutenolidase